MTCCGIVHYWCCLKDEQPSQPWYDRNNCYRITSVIVFMLAALMLFIAVTPVMYGIGLLIQFMFTGKSMDMYGYSYIDNSLTGLMAIITIIVVGSGLILCIGKLVSNIYDCYINCTQCCREYEEINSKHNENVSLNV